MILCPVSASQDEKLPIKVVMFGTGRLGRSLQEISVSTQKMCTETQERIITTLAVTFYQLWRDIQRPNPPAIGMQGLVC